MCKNVNRKRLLRRRSFCASVLFLILALLQIVTYTVRVTNTGPSDALTVVVTDTLPDNPQLTYLSDTGGCTIIGSILTCAVGNLTVGSFRQFDVKIKIAGNQGTLTNTATVTSSTVDPNVANDSASVDISF